MSLETNIKTYATIDDEIKRIRGEVKKLRTNKTSLEQHISSEMTQKELEEVSLQDETKIKMVTKTRKTNPFKKDNVMKCAVVLFGEEKSASLVKMIEELQETAESTCLKRMNPKKRKQQD